MDNAEVRRRADGIGNDVRRDSRDVDCQRIEPAYATLLVNAYAHGSAEGAPVVAPAAEREEPKMALDVLVVDGDHDTRLAVAGAVTLLGYVCRSAPDGQAALEEQARRPAAIVLTEWSMPRLDGLRLCAALKRAPSPPFVILMTTMPDSVSLFATLRRGADHVLRKPFGLDELEVGLGAATRHARGASSGAQGLKA